jgi:hypothetical protein
MDWLGAFTEREKSEIRLAVLYAQDFNHGTDGHNAKIIIAKMVKILESNKIENYPPQDAFEKKKG